MKVEVWSDIVCPWCYIGKRRLEGALAVFDHADEVELHFRSFELDPAAAPASGQGLDQRLAQKYGVPIEQARAMNTRVSDTAALEGLTYRLDIARPANTFDAHRLIHLARSESLEAVMKERLMAAYFTEGAPIGDHETLAGLAEAVGISPVRARAVLASDEFASDVRAEEGEAAALGINGVPFFVIDRRFGVSGAQPAQVLRQALETAWAKAS
jgi:predicted DsbA family dithiol-disulfide isomerase